MTDEGGDPMTVEEVLALLEVLGRPEAVEGIGRWVIVGAKAYGVRIPDLRQLAREIGWSPGRAEALGQVDSADARILAGFIYPPKALSEGLTDHWVTDFNSREVCDPRNTAKKAFERALGVTDKRSLAHNRMAVAETMRRLDSRTARWSAADALRELNSDALQARLTRKEAAAQ